MRLLIPFSLVAAITGSPTLTLAADFDGPYYRERDVLVERPAAPVVVERERVRGPDLLCAALLCSLRL